MRTILLAAALSALASSAFAGDPGQPQKSTLYVGDSGTAIALVFPAGPDETVMSTVTDRPSISSVDPIGSTAVLVTLWQPGVCSNISVSTSKQRYNYKFCSEQERVKGSADSFVVLSGVVDCLRRGGNRELCEQTVPENAKRTAQGTATSVLPEEVTGRAD